MFEIDLDVIREYAALLRTYTKEMRILIVEDYEELRLSLEKICSFFFAEVGVAADGGEGLRLYKDKISQNQKYNIVLSDIVMPGMNGISLTKEIHALDVEQVIMIFSAHQDSRYLLELINLDVRRFILKPISLHIFLSEILLVCKTLHNTQEQSNRVQLRNNIIYDKNLKELFIDAQIVKLTHYERLILELLVSKIHQTVSNEEIFNYIYLFDTTVKLDNVRKTLHRLRKKISNDLIENIYAIGYKLS